MDTESKVDNRTWEEQLKAARYMIALVKTHEDKGNRAHARHYLAGAITRLASASLLLAYPADEEA